MQIFDIIALLIFCSGLFIFINNFLLKLPSSIGLMLLALLLSVLVMGFGYFFPEYHLADQVKQYDFSEVMYRFVLSVMLFAGALKVDFKKLGKQLIPVLVLSFFGVLISTLTIGTLMYYLLDTLSIDLNYIGCLVFGALISSTDPIAVTKTIRRFKLSEELERKISGESLLNGGIAIVLAFSLVNIYQEQAENGLVTFTQISTIFIQDLLGGTLVGLIFGWLGYKLLKFIDNDVVEAEVLVTLALVMGGSYLGDLLSVSSMLVATMTGLIIGNFDRDESTGESAVGEYVYKFWQLLEESLAAMIFVLIGFQMLVLPVRLDYYAAGFFGIAIVVFARWLSVLVPIKLMSTRLSFDKGTISVLSWGAIRGGLPVAFTLSLTNFEEKDVIITLTYVVVVCTIIYQGLTIGPVIKLYKNNN
ncbi:MAG: sodium:proton antiporter [Cytophagales bacterium]|nr:sodium:proton antiporter [Cytophagales bacterium]